jgi:hypothetical protein
MTAMHPIATQENRPAGDDPRRAGRSRLRMTPGRQAALIFGVPVCLGLVAATALSFAADLGTSSYRLDYAFPASATRVSVSTGGGQLTLQQAAIRQATLTGTASYSFVRPHPVTSLSGGVAGYDYRCRLPVGNCGLNATVTIPVGMPASVSTGGGNLAVTGTTGAVSLNTDGGELAARNVSGGVSLSTGGGNITVGTVSGTLMLNTDGGNIQATTVRSTDVTAGTGGGNITITFTVVPRDVNVSTSGGDITIVVPRDPRQHYRVTASTDGGSTSVAVPQSSSSPDVITATSGGGNITITQS